MIENTKGHQMNLSHLHLKISILPRNYTSTLCNMHMKCKHIQNIYNSYYTWNMQCHVINNLLLQDIISVLNDSLENEHVERIQHLINRLSGADHTTRTNSSRYVPWTAEMILE